MVNAMTRTQVAFGISCLFTAASSLACKYSQVSLKESVGQAQSVFVARAETASNGRSGRGPDIPTSMRVIQVVKGSAKVGQVVPVYTSNSSCGLGVQIGQGWLILANGEPLRSDQPSGSMLLTDPAARKLVLDELGLKVDPI
jgi:hypothetical protein